MKHDNRGENAKAIQGACSQPKGDGAQKPIAGSTCPPPKEGAQVQNSIMQKKG
jgi:hypothetical protein